jgi:hypothetical protein
MSPTTLALLILIAVFLLLTLTAAVRSLWLRLRSPGSSKTTSEWSFGKSTASDGLLLLGVAMAWYNVSSGWIAQLTIYPIYADMSVYGPQAFHAFRQGYLSRLPIIILPAGVMFLSWALLLWLPCRNVPPSIVWGVVALCVALVALTPIAAGAQDQMYNEGFSNDLHARLLWSHAIRSVLFTGIGLLSLAAVRSRWTTRSNHELAPND